MAQFVPNDASFEGRQFTRESYISLQKWLDASIVHHDGNLWGIHFRDGSTQPVNLSDWILLDPATGTIEVYTPDDLKEKFKPAKLHEDVTFGADLEPATSHRSVGAEEIEKRFGHHKATLEGAEATAPKHAMLRKIWKDMANRLDGILPQGRYKALVMTEMEQASMWSHKAIAEAASE